MNRARRRLASLAIALAVLIGGGLLLGRMLLPDDSRFAGLISERFEAASGIGLRIGQARWTLWPVPAIVIEQIATLQATPITVRRIVLRPRLGALWQRQIALASLTVDGAVLPSASARAFRGRWDGSDTSTALSGLPGGWTLAALPLAQLRLRDLVWIDRRNIALAYDADIAFDPGWLPRTAELRRSELEPPARLRLERESEPGPGPGSESAADPAREAEVARWRTSIDVARGSWNGNTELQRDAAGRFRLSASLAPKDVDVALLAQSFGRHALVEGKAFGQSEVDAAGADLSELLHGLHTRTRFEIAPAALNGFDLQRAIRSAGTSRGGSTALDSLSGTLDTQLEDDGVRMSYSGLKARSGVLSASGKLSIINRRLNGEAAVDIVDGVVGMPLKLGGTLDAPELSLTGAALTGAAVGTAVLPGVGTAIGARVGQQVERLFGAGADHRGSSTQTKPAAAAPSPGGTR